jgi:hypothetical protein
LSYVSPSNNFERHLHLIPSSQKVDH